MSIKEIEKMGENARGVLAKVEELRDAVRSEALEGVISSPRREVWVEGHYRFGEEAEVDIGSLIDTAV